MKQRLPDHSPLMTMIQLLVYFLMAIEHCPLPFGGDCWFPVFTPKTRLNQTTREVRQAQHRCTWLIHWSHLNIVPKFLVIIVQSLSQRNNEYMETPLIQITFESLTFYKAKRKSMMSRNRFLWFQLVYDFTVEWINFHFAFIWWGN